MPIPPFVAALRERVGADHLLWLPGVTAVVLRGAPGAEEVLLVRRSDNGRWAPVTGIVDPGEHPAVTAVRETQEETGVEAVVETLARVGVGEPMTHANGDRAQYLDHTFRCRHVSGEARVGDDESTEVGWFALDDLPGVPAHLEERIRVAVTHEGPTRL